MLFGSSFIVVIFVFVSINYSALTTNKLITENSHFTFSEIIFPHTNSKLISCFHKYEIGNLEYYSPDKNSYFWTNGNGKLPCVNSKQINYFIINYHFMPQMRTNKLKDGFYSKKVTTYE